MRSTSLRGHLLAISKPVFTKGFDQEMSTLTFLVPELWTTLSVRMASDSLDKMGHGSYTLTGVQPVPYVNRIRPTSLFSIRRTNEPISLTDLHDFSVCLTDLPLLANSIAFENFCEIESAQFGRKRLASAVVASGRLVYTKTPMMMLQSLDDEDRSVEMFIRHELVSGLVGGLASLKSYEGKLVTVLCLNWYSVPLIPEALLIQEASEDIVTEAAAGFVRTRIRVDQEIVLSKFPSIDLNKIPNTCLDGDFISWKSTRFSSDRLVSLFTNEMCHLADLKLLQLGSGIDCLDNLCNPQNILDFSKLKTIGLANALARKSRLFDTFLTLIIETSENGSLPRSLKELKVNLTSRGIQPVGLWWLRGVGLLSSNEHGIYVTDLGYNVGYEIVRIRASEIVDSTNCIDLLSQSHLDIPTPLLLKHLAADRNMVPLEHMGAKCELFWIRKSLASSSGVMILQARTKLEALADNVLEALGSESFSLATSAVQDRLRRKGMSVSYTALSLILSWMQRTSEIRNEDGLWSFPLNRRIQRLLSKPRSAFTRDEILTELRLPQSERLDVQKTLEELKSAGYLTLVGGRWLLASSDANFRRALLLNDIRRDARVFVFETLRKHGRHADLEWTLAELRFYLRKRIPTYDTVEISLGDVNSLSKELINDMILNRDLTEKSGRLSF